MDFGLSALVGGSFCEVVKTLGGALGTAAGTPPAKEWLGGVRTRVAGRPPLPENHDLVRGIRIAHLAAVDKVARRHADLLKTLAAHEIGRDEHPYAASVRGWLDQRLKLLTAGKIDFAAVDEAAVARVLDDMVHPSAVEGYAETAQHARERAEDAALAEIAADAGRRAPPLFDRVFRGENAPGWYETFALFVNERIKGDERFRAIFLAAELVDIKRLVAAAEKAMAAALLRGVEQLDRKLDAVKDDTSVIRDDTGAMRAMLEQFMTSQGATAADRSALLQQIEETRAAHELALQAIAGFFRDVGETPLAPADYPRQFAAFAERYRALLAEAERRTNLPARFEDERARAADAIRAGALDEADAILRALRARLAGWRREQEERLREQQQTLEQTARDEAGVLSESAGIARTRLRYREAAALHAEAAALVALDAEAAWRHTMESASALYNQGDEFGDNDALLDTIRCYHEALALAPRQNRPSDWAATQNNLGSALATLGGREAGTARLEAAVEAYRAALEECTRERAPLDWAMTQNNLGTALQALGGREAGTARLEAAVEAYRAALEERTRERAPLNWAATQNNLGSAFQALGGREAGTARLEAAVEAYRAALEERTRERAPLDWALTMENVALAESAWGEKTGDQRRFRAALTACEAALEVYRHAGATFHIEKATRLRDNLASRLGDEA